MKTHLNNTDFTYAFQISLNNNNEKNKRNVKIR